MKNVATESVSILFLPRTAIIPHVKVQIVRLKNEFNSYYFPSITKLIILHAKGQIANSDRQIGAVTFSGSRAAQVLFTLSLFAMLFTPEKGHSSLLHG